MAAVGFYQIPIQNLIAQLYTPSPRSYATS